MWLDGEDTETGRRVHRLVAAALTADAAGDPFDVVGQTRTMFRSAPFGAGASHALRFRCSSAVTVYLLRCKPLGWELVGTEVPVGAAVADAVWSNGECVVIDELKSGRVDPTARRAADQLQRLSHGGARRWGGRFAGVRLVPLATPAATSFHRLIDGELRPAPLPGGMEVRS